jgi:hypothetical protein
LDMTRLLPFRRERGRVSQPLTPKVKSVMSQVYVLMCPIANVKEMPGKYSLMFDRTHIGSAGWIA